MFCGLSFGSFTELATLLAVGVLKSAGAEDPGYSAGTEGQGGHSLIVPGVYWPVTAV